MNYNVVGLVQNNMNRELFEMLNKVLCSTRLFLKHNNRKTFIDLKVDLDIALNEIIQLLDKQTESKRMIISQDEFSIVHEILLLPCAIVCKLENNYVE